MSSMCFLKRNGEIHQSLLLTDTTAQINMTIMAVESCHLRILTIGAGASGGVNGGGSGYLHYENIVLKQGMYSVMAKVANGSENGYESSMVGVFGIFGDTIHTANNAYGMNGYSGGARQGSECVAGSDGSDGHCSGSGSGTGEDIRDYAFNTWKLTPGDPGRGSFSQWSGPLGGGGGGILVDGSGPEADEE